MWALVAAVEVDLAQAQAAVSHVKDVKLVKVARVLKAHQEALAQLEQDVREQRRALSEITSASTGTVEERRAALAAASKARKAADDAVREAAGMQRQQEEVRRKANQILNALEAARESQMREMRAETRAADAAAEQARAAVARAQEAVQKARAEEAAAAQGASGARQRRAAEGEDAEACAHEEAAARQELLLLQLQNAQRNGMIAFGERMPALLKGELAQYVRRSVVASPQCADAFFAACHIAAIAASKAFSAPPVGPLGAKLRLSDPKWGAAVTETIGEALNNFLVATPSDARALQALAAEVGIARLGVIAVSNLDAAAVYRLRPDIVPDPSLRTLLSVLSSDVPAVLNSLIDSRRIECTVLFDDEALAKRIAWGGNDERLSRNVRDVFLPSGVRLFLRGASQWRLPRQKHGTACLGADMSAQLAAATTMLAELQSRCAEMDSRRREADAAVRRADDDMRRAKQRTVAASAALSNALADFDDARLAAAAAAAAGADDGGAADVAAYNEQLRELADEEARLGERLAAAQTQADAAAAAAAGKRAAAAQVNDNALAMAERAAQLSDALTAAAHAVEKAKREVEHYAGMQAKFCEELKAAEANAKEAAEKLEEFTCKATCYVSKEEADAIPPTPGESGPANAETLRALVAKAEARIAKEQSRNKRSKELVEADALAAERELKRAKKVMEHASAPAERMRSDYVKRRKLMTDTSLRLASTVSTHFNTHMNERGHAGVIAVNYPEGEVRLEVQMANAAPGATGAATQTVTDMKQLSGGERSFTTLSYMLSLNVESDSPFCAMDECDVFMDRISQKVALKKMLEYAGAHRHKQFIVLTPNDISSVKPSEFVAIKQLKPRCAA